MLLTVKLIATSLAPSFSYAVALSIAVVLFYTVESFTNDPFIILPSAILSLLLSGCFNLYCLHFHLFFHYFRPE
jgi:hypothetical protein